MNGSYHPSTVYGGVLWRGRGGEEVKVGSVGPGTSMPVGIKYLKKKTLQAPI